jgi:multidrug efflux system membrane fusion protein
MKRTTKILLPILIVAIGALGAWYMIAFKDEPERQLPETQAPLVRVSTVTIVDMTLTVASQGTVSPRTESTLSAEVAGLVVEVSPSFVSGGFFEENAVLLRIDSQDYRQALTEAESRMAGAELRIAQEAAASDLARAEWSELGEGAATPLTLHEPHLAQAAAAVAAARESVEQARRNLERTEVRAPYAGRLRQKQVDLGQFVNRGAPLASIYAVDAAEVRLPLPDDDLAFVDLPLSYRDQKGDAAGPAVILHADFAGQRYEWAGRIVRTEGEIDPRSRMVHAVARVDDPYRRGEDPQRPPLASGLWVTATISGRSVKNVSVLARAALRDEDQVWVLDEDDRIRFRDVDVLRKTADEVIIQSGLDAGERVVLSQLAVVTNGMRVRTTASPTEGSVN